MTPDQEALIDRLVESLDAVADPAERHQTTSEVAEQVNVALRGVRQRIATELHDSGKPWREVGEIMGGVSSQRAHQIANGA